MSDQHPIFIEHIESLNPRQEKELEQVKDRFDGEEPSDISYRELRDLSPVQLRWLINYIQNIRKGDLRDVELDLKRIAFNLIQARQEGLVP